MKMAVAIVSAILLLATSALAGPMWGMEWRIEKINRMLDDMEKTGE